MFEAKKIEDLRRVEDEKERKKFDKVKQKKDWEEYNDRVSKEIDEKIKVKNEAKMALVKKEKEEER